MDMQKSGWRTPALAWLKPFQHLDIQRGHTQYARFAARHRFGRARRKLSSAG